MTSHKMNESRKILISINPEYVAKIIDETKKYEFRTRVAKKDINAIIIYSTYPVKLVVAEAEILDILEMNPEKLWEETYNFSGIEKNSFDQYFKNREIAYAYKLGRVTVYKKPKKLVDFGIKFAPQSFVYLRT